MNQSGELHRPGVEGGITFSEVFAACVLGGAPIVVFFPWAVMLTLVISRLCRGLHVPWLCDGLKLVADEGAGVVPDIGPVVAEAVWHCMNCPSNNGVMAYFCGGCGLPRRGRLVGERAVVEAAVVDPRDREDDRVFGEILKGRIGVRGTIPIVHRGLFLGGKPVECRREEESVSMGTICRSGSGKRFYVVVSVTSPYVGIFCGWDLLTESIDKADLTRGTFFGFNDLGDAIVRFRTRFGEEGIVPIYVGKPTRVE